MRLASSVVCFEYARLTSLHSGETLRDMRVEHGAVDGRSENQNERSAARVRQILRGCTCDCKALKTVDARAWCTRATLLWVPSASSAHFGKSLAKRAAHGQMTGPPMQKRNHESTRRGSSASLSHHACELLSAVRRRGQLAATCGNRQPCGQPRD